MSGKRCNSRREEKKVCILFYFNFFLSKPPTTTGNKVTTIIILFLFFAEEECARKRLVRIRCLFCDIVVAKAIVAFSIRPLSCFLSFIQYCGPLYLAKYLK